MSKYYNVKTTIDGITFDSKKEAARYCELKLLEQGKVITDLQLQPKFEIQPGYIKNGRKVKPVYYIADFSYKENGRLIVEDVKGKRTKEYLLKKKLVEYKYPFEIKEI